MALAFARPIHPGEILREEYLIPLNLSAGKLAKALSVPRSRMERIVGEEIGITTDTAFRLGKFFRTSPKFWMNMQQSYELAVASQSLPASIADIRPYDAAAA